jgi:hypothetical protein
MTETELAGIGEVLGELAPVLRRAAALDPAAVTRLRASDGVVGVLVGLPFGVLVGRSVTAPPGEPLDVVVRAADLLDWLDGETEASPQRRDAEWRGGSPPVSGWHRFDTVPDAVIRPLVRTGALTLSELGERVGVPGAQPRAEVTDALLDAVVLTVTADDGSGAAEITLRAVSALIRMGFVPPGSQVHVERRGRWIRLLATFGAVYLEAPGGALGIAPRRGLG